MHFFADYCDAVDHTLDDGVDPAGWYIIYADGPDEIVIGPTFKRSKDCEICARFLNLKGLTPQQVECMSTDEWLRVRLEMLSALQW